MKYCTGIIVAIVFAIFMNQQIPEDCPNPLETRLLLISNIFIDFLSSTLEYFRLAEKRQASRYMQNHLLQMYDLLWKRSSDVQIENHHFDGVRVLVFSPKSALPEGPAIMYIHGGDWTKYSPEHYRVFLSDLARQMRVVVAAVDFRSSPESLYPTALDDCRRALQHLLNPESGAAHLLKVSPARVALAGDGTGGGMAAALVHWQFNTSRTASSNPHRVKLLFLFRPVLQFFTFKSAGQSTAAARSLITGALTYLLGVDALPRFLDVVLREDHVTCARRAQLLSQLAGTPLAAALELSASGRDCAASLSSATEATNLHQLSALATDVQLSPLLSLANALQLGHRSAFILPPIYMNLCENDAVRDDALTYKQLADKLSFSVHLRRYRGCGTSMPLESAQHIRDYIDRNALL